MFTGVYIVLNCGQLVSLGAERELGGEPGPVGGQGRQYQGGVRDAGVRTSKTLQGGIQCYQMSFIIRNHKAFQ